MILYLLHYNDYYNRIVKKENTLSAYQKYVIGNPIEGVNFIPNDYINTTQIVNWTERHPDYILVVNEEGNIDSRWFVISTRRIRQGQLELTLHRDLIVDFYDNVKDAPCFIEKATPLSIRDVALYNKENMTFNQIKQREQLLYDETRCPWIVGYIPRDSFKTDTTVSVNAQLSGAADITVDRLSDYQFYKYNNSVVSGKVTNPTIRIAVTYWLMQRTSTGSYQNYYYGNSIKLNQDGTFVGCDHASGQTSLSGYYWQQTNTNILNIPSNKFTDDYARIVASRMTTLSNDFHNLSDYIQTGGISPTEYNQLIKDNGKIIYESSSGKYFKIKITGTSSGDRTTTQIPWNSSLGIKMQNAMVKEFDGYKLLNPINPTSTLNNPFTFTSDTAYQTLTIEPQEVKLSVKVPALRYQASESPYDIFCMPYSDTLTIKRNGNTYVSKTNKAAALTLAQQIGAKVGSSQIYDIQILPYCPVRYCIQADGSFDIGSAIYTDIVANNTDRVGVLLWATTDNFTFNIPISIPEEQNILQKKVANETEFIRLVSPNLSNFFEFSPQMNNGLDYVSIVCQYKPFNPYIKIQPNFKGMYGNSFNDARGLICNGDFSLAQITSAWADYELQNKNYQQMFSREMQNLRTTQDIQRQQEVWGMIAGVAGAGGSGAAGGAMVGGPIGAAVGGTIGGLASLGAGLADLHLNDQLRNETLNYKQDMYRMSLQNIQALPYGLAKTSAVAPDNRMVPFIEFYSCTSQEKEALKNKLSYNGFTINMIGTISQYLREDESYIKGKLIRLYDLNEDYHIATALADEVNQGMFITNFST